MKIKKILVVEDDMIIQMFISKVLSDAGYEIIGEARSSRLAIQMAEQYQPDLVLMDIGLSGTTDGVETARIISESWKIPIAFITGNSDQATLKRAQEINPVEFITKPIDEARLQSTIDRLNSK